MGNLKPLLQTNLNMKLRNSVFFSCIGVLGLAFTFSNLNPLRQPVNDPGKEAALIRTILTGLSREHFQPKPVDDDFSKAVFNLYLKDIDGNKRFLSQADFEALKQYELDLDDEANKGTFEFFNLSIERFDLGLNKSENWYKEFLANPIDFSKEETLEGDGDKLKWAKDDAELRSRWEKALKYEVLSRIVQEQDKQDKPDFKGEKKSFETLEVESRKKVLDVYDKWYKRLHKATRENRLEMYLNAITNYFDPHTNYFSPKDKESFDIQMSGKLEGIGARLISDGEKTTVTEVVVGGPAWKEGQLEAKDVILSVAQENAEFVDVMGLEIDDVVSKIRGPKGTKVKLNVQKVDGSIKEITLVRDVVVMEESLAKSLLLNTTDQSDKIGYIYLPKFYADFTPQGVTSCSADVAKEIEKLKKENIQGIILDLRGNGGGSLRDVVTMSGLFIEQGPIVQVKSRAKTPEIMEDVDPRTQYKGPLIVMVNGYSASASEILAAAMQDYDRALIVGSRGTYGKGTVQRFLDLDRLSNGDFNGSLGDMKLTVQKFYRITGSTTQLDGVKPDIVLPDALNLIDLGEVENDYPLASTTINPVAFKQSTYNILDKQALVSASNARVKSNETFQLINENAKRLKKQKDNTTYPLNKDKYIKWDKGLEQEAEKFENMFKPIDNLAVENLAVDLPAMANDTARTSRNVEWIKDRKKDIQLYETVLIMKDMIKNDRLAGKN